MPKIARHTPSPSTLVLLVVALAGTAIAQEEPDCVAVTTDGDRLEMFLQAPRPGFTVVGYEPDCPQRVRVDGFATVGPRLFDFYFVLDSSGSTGACTGVDVDGDLMVGRTIPAPFGDRWCTDVGDSVLAAEVRAIRDFVALLAPDRSRVAIIQFSNPEGPLGFGGRQRVVQSLTSDFARIDAALDEILLAGHAGATDYAGGLQLAREEAAHDGDPVNRRQVVHFLSDGAPTFPVSPFFTEEAGDAEPAVDEASLAALAGLVINTFGIGFTPSVSADPVVPPRCERPAPGGGTELVSTLECLALRTGGDFFASNDPADILRELVLNRAAGIESVTVWNDTLGVEEEATLAPDGGWTAAVPLLPGEVNLLRALAVAEDGTTCEVATDALALCFASTCDPRTQGYWHRQCAGPHPSWDHDLLLRLLAALADPAVAALGSERDTTACEGLDADPPSDPCQRAIKQYTALLLNTLGGQLDPDCEIDLSSIGPDLPTTAGEALELVAALVRAGLAGDTDACKEANDIADLINTGAAVTGDEPPPRPRPSRGPAAAPGFRPGR